MSGNGRRRGGQPKNLNAARHGLTAWLKRRALPKDKEHIGPLVQEYRKGLLTCKGGEDEASEVEVALVENAARAFGACLLVLEEAAARGAVRVVDGSWDLSPGFARLVGFLNAERQALGLLGPERRAKPVPDPFKEQELRLRAEALARQAMSASEGRPDG